MMRSLCGIENTQGEQHEVGDESKRGIAKGQKTGEERETEDL